MRKGKRIQRWKDKFGYTLIELMVSILLSAIMFLSVVVAAHTGMISMRTTDSRVYLHDQLRQAVTAFSREVVQSSPAQIVAHFGIVADGNGNSVVTFQIPVDADGDTDWGGVDRRDVIDNNTENVQWGAHANLGNEDFGDALLGQWVRYSVQQNAALPDSLQQYQLIRDVLLTNGTSVDPNAPSKVIANNITRFQVAQNSERLTVTLEAQHRDNQLGGAAKILRDSYTTDLVLRNNVY